MCANDLKEKILKTGFLVPIEEVEDLVRKHYGFTIEEVNLDWKHIDIMSGVFIKRKESYE